MTTGPELLHSGRAPAASVLTETSPAALPTLLLVALGPPLSHPPAFPEKELFKSVSRFLSPLPGHVESEVRF